MCKCWDTNEQNKKSGMISALWTSLSEPCLNLSRKPGPSSSCLFLWLDMGERDCMSQDTCIRNVAQFVKWCVFGNRARGLIKNARCGFLEHFRWPLDVVCAWENDLQVTDRQSHSDYSLRPTFFCLLLNPGVYWHSGNPEVYQHAAKGGLGTTENGGFN